jgi:hypothetical protein
MRLVSFQQAVKKLGSSGHWLLLHPVAPALGRHDFGTWLLAGGAAAARAQRAAAPVGTARARRASNSSQLAASQQQAAVAVSLARCGSMEPRRGNVTIAEGGHAQLRKDAMQIPGRVPDASILPAPPVPFMMPARMPTPPVAGQRACLPHHLRGTAIISDSEGPAPAVTVAEKQAAAGTDLVGVLSVPDSMTSDGDAAHHSHGSDHHHPAGCPKHRKHKAQVGTRCWARGCMCKRPTSRRIYVAIAAGLQYVAICCRFAMHRCTSTCRVCSPWAYTGFNTACLGPLLSTISSQWFDLSHVCVYAVLCVYSATVQCVQFYTVHCGVCTSTLLVGCGGCCCCCRTHVWRTGYQARTKAILTRKVCMPQVFLHTCTTVMMATTARYKAVAVDFMSTT